MVRKPIIMIIIRVAESRATAIFLPPLSFPLFLLSRHAPLILLSDITSCALRHSYAAFAIEDTSGGRIYIYYEHLDNSALFL